MSSKLHGIYLKLKEFLHGLSEVQTSLDVLYFDSLNLATLHETNLLGNEASSSKSGTKRCKEIDSRCHRVSTWSSQAQRLLGSCSSQTQAPKLLCDTFIKLIWVWFLSLSLWQPENCFSFSHSILCQLTSYWVRFSSEVALLYTVHSKAFPGSMSYSHPKGHLLLELQLVFLVISNFLSPLTSLTTTFPKINKCKL